MDFSYLLDLANKNKEIAEEKVNIKRYDTQVSTAKKVAKSKVQSDAVKKFLEKKGQEETEKRKNEKIKKENLLALRAQDKKASKRVNAMLHMTKSSNKAAIEDAVDKNDTADTLTGFSQCDEDDYGYTSQEASAMFNKMLNMYKNIPDEDKFGKSMKKSVKDLSSIKDRVKASLVKQQDEEALGRHKPRKRKKKSTDDDFIDDTVQTSGESHMYLQMDQIKKDRQDAERLSKKYKRLCSFEQEEANMKKDKDEVKQKPKKKQQPPPMDFNDLLKLAEKKHQEKPLAEIVEEATIKKTEKKELDKSRPMTAREKADFLLRKQQEEAKKQRELDRKNKSTDSGKKLVSSTEGEKKGFKIPKKIPRPDDESPVLKKVLTAPDNSRYEIYSKLIPERKTKNNSEERKKVVTQDKSKMGFNSSSERSQNNVKKLSDPPEKSKSDAKFCDSKLKKHSGDKYASLSTDNKRFIDDKNIKLSSENKTVKKTANLTSENKTLSPSIEKRTMKKSLNPPIENKNVIKSMNSPSQNKLIKNSVSKTPCDNKNVKTSSEDKGKVANKPVKISSDNRADNRTNPPSENKSQNIPTNSAESSKGHILKLSSEERKKLAEAKIAEQKKQKLLERKAALASAVSKPERDFDETKTKKVSSPVSERRPSIKGYPENKVKTSSPAVNKDRPSSDGKGKLTNKKMSPSDAKGKQLPPADVKGRQFPPADVRGRQFPPADVRGRQFPPADVRRKQISSSSKKKRRIESSDEEDSDMDGFIVDEADDQDYSKHIRDIFGYDKRRYMYEDDDDDDQCMESSYNQQIKEEIKSTKMGIIEDLMDVRREKAKKKSKVARH